MALRIMTICTANVCRSPMAAALLANHCEINGLDVIVRSCGTHAGPIPVDPAAVTVMAEHGLSIADHVPRLLSPRVVAEDGADLMIAMTRSHLRTVALMAADAFQRSFTAKELVRRAAGLTSADPHDTGPDVAGWRKALGQGRLTRDLLSEDPDDDVADPYGMSLAVHRRTADELDLLMTAVARSITDWQSAG